MRISADQSTLVAAVHLENVAMALTIVPQAIVCPIAMLLRCAEDTVRAVNSSVA